MTTKTFSKRPSGSAICGPTVVVGIHHASAGHRADSKFPLNGRQTAVIIGFSPVATEH